MNNFTQRFTKWYYRKGYRMTYKPHDTELIFSCPFWIRPFTYFFFSPCAYYREAGYDFGQGFENGLKGILG